MALDCCPVANNNTYINMVAVVVVVLNLGIPQSSGHGVFGGVAAGNAACERAHATSTAISAAHRDYFLIDCVLASTPVRSVRGRIYRFN